MNNLKQKLLNKEYGRFRLISGVIFHSVFTLTTLLAAGFIVFTVPELKGKTFIFWLALFNSIAQLIVIWYLYYSKAIPSFARNAIYLSFGFGNVWLCLFLLSFNIGFKH